MVINQAMAVPRGRDAGARYVRDFIEEMKSSGFVAQAGLCYQARREVAVNFTTD